MITLRNYVERVLRERDERYLAHFAAQREQFTNAMMSAKEAVNKAEVSIEHRLTLLNELREGVATSDQLQLVSDRLGELRERIDRVEGRSSGLNAGWSYLVSAAAVALSIYIASR